MTSVQLGPLSRTLVQLRPRQAVARARLRAQRALLSRAPLASRLLLLRGPKPSAVHGWPAGYIPLDGRAVGPWPRLADLQAARIQLLGVERDMGEPYDWQRSGEPQLWRFHLQYWDWAWGLAADADRHAARSMFAGLWRSWRDVAPLGRGDAWHPYPASLRAWSWCGQFGSLVRDSDIEDEFVADLARHTGFVRRFLEFDVGGNHLVKNLKAAIGLALFFRDERLLRQSLKRLIAQLPVQVLPDGGHFERSPAYHCQVLADFTDIAELMNAAGRSRPAELDVAIKGMRAWLDTVASPDGAVPLLNDGFPVAPRLLAALRGTTPPRAAFRVLADTGLVRAAAGDWELLADVGLPCPPDLPAHAHADSLSCVVHFKHVPFLVDTGTSGYAPGPARSYERSTAAHNTVEIDCTNSTEVWGAFRAGRRARIHGMQATATPAEIIVTAAHDGYRALPGRPLHYRRWSLSDDGLHVDDEVTGHGRHHVVVRWHLAPGLRVQLTASGAEVRMPGGLVSFIVKSGASVSVASETSLVAVGFDRTVPAQTLTCQVDAELPVVISTSWSSRAPRTKHETHAADHAAGEQEPATTELVSAEDAR